MDWGIFLAVGAVAAGVIIGVIIGMKNRKLMDQGVANKNRSADFYMQETTFKTVVPDLQTVLGAMDTDALSGQKINVTKDSEHNRLIFRDSGSFAATLRDAGSSAEGIHCFVFRMNTWKNTKYGSIEMSARMGANIVLTTIEKAFLTLDYNAVAERVYVTDLKSETSFF